MFFFFLDYYFNLTTQWFNCDNCSIYFEGLKPRPVKMSIVAHLWLPYSNLLFLNLKTIYSSFMCFGSAKYSSLRSTSMHIWPFYFCFHLSKICFAFAGWRKESLSRVLCQISAEKNGFRSKYPARCGTDGQNMFLDRGHAFPEQPVAVSCALSTHLLDWKREGWHWEKKKKKTCFSSKETNLHYLPSAKLDKQHPTGKRLVKGSETAFPLLRQSIRAAY